MWRSSVLLPQPLPPMMTKMSPAVIGEVEIALDHEVAVGHGQVLDAMTSPGAALPVDSQMPSTLQRQRDDRRRRR